MKTVLITGTSSGLGKSLAKKFIENDYVVVGWGRNNDKLIEEMEQYVGTQYIPQQVDIKNINSVQFAVSELIDNKINVDVLVNNAGIFSQLPFLEMKLEDIEDVINTNLLGTIYVTQTVLTNFKLHRIINIASVSAIDGIKNQSVYSSSKSGMKAFFNALSQELKEIYVTNIYPGGINTELWKTDPIGYGGNFENLIDPNQIFDFIQPLLNSTVTVKEITLFPTEEWHP